MLPIMIVTVLDEKGQITSVVPYLDMNAAASDYEGAKAEFGERAELFFAKDSGAPADKIVQVPELPHGGTVSSW